MPLENEHPWTRNVRLREERRGLGCRHDQRLCEAQGQRR